MVLEFHIPSAPLDQFVSGFVYHEGYAANYSKDKLLPDGSVNLIIDLREIPKYIYDNADLSPTQGCRKGWLSGIRNEHIIFDASTRETAMLVVTFKPHGAHTFFGFPMNEIMNRVVELEDIWGRSFLNLREQLLEIATISGRFAAVERFLLGKAADRLELHPCVNYAVNILSTAVNGTAIRSLREKIGFSHKHFIHLFESHVGMTPKSFGRIMKFQKVIRQLETAAEINWAQIALDCGYYDQAHFSNEFKKFSGISPSSYLQQKGDFVNYLQIG